MNMLIIFCWNECSDNVRYTPHSIYKKILYYITKITIQPLKTQEYRSCKKKTFFVCFHLVLGTLAVAKSARKKNPNFQYLRT